MLAASDRFASALQAAQDERSRPEEIEVGAGIGVALTFLSAEVSDLRDIAISALAGAAMARAGEPEELEEPVFRSPPRLAVDPVENERLPGTHVIARHLERTLAQLRARFAASGWRLARTSTFPDLDTAQRAVQDAVDASEQRIAAWLNSPERHRLDPDIVFDTHRVVGLALTRDAARAGGALVETSVVRVVLCRSDASPCVDSRSSPHSLTCPEITRGMTGDEDDRAMTAMEED